MLGRAALCLAFVLSLATFTSAWPWKPWCQYPALIDATAEQLQAGLKLGCFSSVDLVKAYIERITEVNATVHAVTELSPDALDIAKDLDRERKWWKHQGPLHGLPVLLKGNIGVAKNLQTTAGSYALLGANVPEDATIVTKLKQAGAIILGTTGMSEWANFRSSNSTNGWSAYGGQVFGAYHHQQDPCGSSSGSGVGADLGLAFGTIGTETSGSIVCPSENNNIVGIKPTVGLTSRHMAIPVSERQDTIGPMARTVKDAALLLQAMAGTDPKDNYTSAIPFYKIPDYSALCKLSSLKGKRIGIPRNVLDLSADPDMDPLLDTFDSAVALLRKSGAIIVDNANYTSYSTFYDSTASAGVTFADFYTALPKYLARLSSNPHNLKNLADVHEFTHRTPIEEYPDRDTMIWDAALQMSMNNTSPEFWAMLQVMLQFGDEGGLLGALRRHNLDAMVLPSTWSYDIPALVGAPVISVPMGAWPESTEVVHDLRGEVVRRAPGFPMGLSFVGDLWSEESLIGMAYAFEQKSEARGKLKRYIEPETELTDVA